MILTKMLLKGIVAMDEDGVIGKDGGLPWHEPEDLKRFKELTQGQICLMGRKNLGMIKTISTKYGMISLCK